MGPLRSRAHCHCPSPSARRALKRDALLSSSRARAGAEAGAAGAARAQPSLSSQSGPGLDLCDQPAGDGQRQVPKDRATSENGENRVPNRPRGAGARETQRHRERRGVGSALAGVTQREPAALALDARLQPVHDWGAQEALATREHCTRGAVSEASARRCAALRNASKAAERELHGATTARKRPQLITSPFEPHINTHATYFKTLSCRSACIDGH